MTNETNENTPAPAKPSFRDRFKRTASDEAETTTRKPFMERAKNVAAVVGVVSVAGVVAAVVAKKTAKDVDASLDGNVETTE